MNYKVKKNKKFILIFISIITIIDIVLIMVALIYYDGGQYKKKEDDKLQEVFVNKDIYIRYFENVSEIGYELAKKGGDWSKLPLSKQFKRKYKEFDGILGEMKYDSIEYRPYALYDDNSLDKYNDYFFRFYDKYFVITKGKRKIVYMYFIKFSDNVNKYYMKDIDDIIFFLIIPITDDDGNDIPIEVDKNAFEIIGSDFTVY